MPFDPSTAVLDDAPAPSTKKGAFDPSTAKLDGPSKLRTLVSQNVPRETLSATRPSGPPDSGPVAVPTTDSQPEPTGGGASRPVSHFGAGLADPVYATEQMVAHSVPMEQRNALAGLSSGLSPSAAVFGTALQTAPSGPAMDANIRDRERNLQTSGTDWSRMGGNFVSSLPFTAAGGPITQGAIMGAMQPVTGEGDFWTQKGVQTAIGAAAGKGGEMVGNALSNIAKPVVTGARKMLMDLGVDLTPGQMFGKNARAVEEIASSAPLMNLTVPQAERRSIETFNRATINQALKPLGKQLPEHLTAGPEAVAHAQEALSDAYGDLLPKLQWHASPDFAADLTGLKTLTKELAPDEAAQFDAILQNRVMSRLKGAGNNLGMDGESFKVAESDLTKKIGDLKRAGKFELADAVTELRSTLQEQLERSNPGAKEQLSGINRAYAMLSRVEDASIRRPKSQGVFTPSDLIASIKSNALRSGRRKAFARGDGLLLDIARAGEEVLPKKIPDSGTATRVLTNSLLGAATVGHVPGAVAALAAGGAGALAYTDPAITALNKYVTSSPLYRNALARLAQIAGKTSVLAAGPAASLAPQITQ